MLQMADGLSCEDALAGASCARLAERDPAADIEGHHKVSKMMILSALVFGQAAEPRAGRLPRHYR